MCIRDRGIVLLLMLTFFNICSINSFGMPYTAPLTPYAVSYTHLCWSP